LRPQSANNQSSRGSSFPLALTFQVPMKKWAYERDQSEFWKNHQHNWNALSSARSFCSRFSTYLSILCKFVLTSSHLFVDPGIPDLGHGFSVPDSSIFRLLVGRSRNQNSVFQPFGRFLFTSRSRVHRCWWSNLRRPRSRSTRWSRRRTLRWILL